MESETYSVAELKCEKESRPIFYAEVTFVLTTGKKRLTHVAKNCVLKGFKKEILDSIETKKSVIKDLYYQDSYAKKKSFNFDFNNVKIISFKVKRFMGYGPKSN